MLLGQKTRGQNNNNEIQPKNKQRIIQTDNKKCKKSV